MDAGSVYVIVALPPATFACPISTPSSLNITIPCCTFSPSSSVIFASIVSLPVVDGVFVITSIRVLRFITSSFDVNVFALYNPFSVVFIVSV